MFIILLNCFNIAMFLVTTLLVPHTIPRNSLVTSLESLEDPSFIARLGRDHCTTKDSDQCLHMLRVAPLRLRQHHLQHEAGTHISLFPSLLSPCWSFWSLGCSHYFVFVSFPKTLMHQRVVCLPKLPLLQCALCWLRRSGEDQWAEGRLPTYHWHLSGGDYYHLGGSIGILYVYESDTQNPGTLGP